MKRLSAQDAFQEGVDRFQTGDFNGAEASFRLVLKIDPLSPAALNALGTVLDRQGLRHEAITAYRHCLKLEPVNLIASYNLGNTLRRHGDLQGAESCYRACCAMDREFTPAVQALGSLLLESGRDDEAEELLLTAANASPPNSDACFNLGTLSQSRGKLGEAEQWYMRALANDKNHLQAHNALGMLCLLDNRIAEAIFCFEKAVAIKPDYWQAQVNLGIAYAWKGELRKAEECHESVLRVHPGNGLAHYNLALALLAQGSFEKGWREFEWRFEKEENPVPKRHTHIPRWRGEDLEGRSILVHAEQGYGDTVQFARYLTFLIEQGASVSLECQDRVISPLMNGLALPLRIFVRGDVLPGADFQVSLMSLPGILGQKAWNRPAPHYYLRPDEESVKEWQRRVAVHSGLKTGLAWAGRKGHANDHNRSIPGPTWRPLAEMENVAFFNLQAGPEHDTAPPVKLVDYTSLIENLADTAAIMKNLDLVITVDSAPAHVAGALGIPVWCLIPYNPDWRWMRDRTDSPLYPSMRLFRQESPEGWNEVLRKVQKELLKLAGGVCC